MATAIPKKINPRWLQQQETKLGCTAKVIRETGEPNPNYAALADEIAAARAEMVRRDAFEAWAKKELGAILNQYPLRTDGQSFEPGRVFFRKDKATGRVDVWTVADAWQQYETIAIS
jgi:hypothetical protein